MVRGEIIIDINNLSILQKINIKNYILLVIINMDLIGISLKEIVIISDRNVSIM